MVKGLGWIYTYFLHHSAPAGAICWLWSFNLLLSCAALRAAFTSARTWLKVLQNSQLQGTEHETPTTEKLRCLEKLGEWCTVQRTCPGVNVFCIRVCLFSHPTGTHAITLYYSTRLEQLRIGSQADLQVMQEALHLRLGNLLCLKARWQSWTTHDHDSNLD